MGYGIGRTETVLGGQSGTSNLGKWWKGSFGTAEKSRLSGASG